MRFWEGYGYCATRVGECDLWEEGLRDGCGEGNVERDVSDVGEELCVEVEGGVFPGDCFGHCG